jgi:hypothetical protein
MRVCRRAASKERKSGKENRIEDVLIKKRVVVGHSRDES